MTARRWQAPTADHGILCDPPMPAAPALVERNRRLLDQANVRIDGVSLRELRASINPKGMAKLMAGHQPELYHPGVWAKVFALNALARRMNAVGIDIIVDNDIAKSARIPVPVLAANPTEVHQQFVPYDSLNGEVIYSEWQLQNRSIFAEVPQKIAELTRAWPYHPIAAEIWNLVPRAGWRNDNPSWALAAARALQERRWIHELSSFPVELVTDVERLPVSNLGSFASYWHFVHHLISDLPRVQEVYNRCVRIYRQRERIRSKNHPVPDLERLGDWLEAPFWLWRSGPQARRQRLFVRRSANVWHLGDGQDEWGIVPIDAPAWDWHALETAGVLCLRPRALTLTMFVRLCMADLFIHGIGGGLYDRLTDDIIRAYFGIEPPGYMVVSGTLRLPLPTFLATSSHRRQLAHLQRDSQWNPQRHLEVEWRNHPRAVALCAEKAALMAEQPPPGPASKARFRRLHYLTAALAEFVAPLDLTPAVQKLDAELAANAILQRRDYPFVLYPEGLLREFLGRFTEPNLGT
jgi:hypothetical protein